MKNREWDEMYQFAKQYYAKNGNLIVTSSSDFKNKLELRKWLITQRRNYKLHKLIKEKIDLLNDLDMVWSLYDLQWYEYYDLAKKFHKENGNLLVPIRYITDDNKKLGSWISHQRRNYKSGNLIKEKIDLLEKIGMIWDPAEMTWIETFKIAKQYYEENKNLNIPDVFFYKNVSLGSWIQTQRYNYNQGTLTDSQIKRLNEIGMEWDPIRSQKYIWDKNYNTISEFYKKYKHLYIPINYISKDGVNIGVWLYDQKLKYAKNELNEYRKAKLDKLDKSWLEPSNTKSSFPEYAVLYYVKKCFPSATKLRTKEISEIDIYIPELKIGIEYDGPMHTRIIKKDIAKSEICTKLGIKLIRIRDCQCPMINDSSYKILLKNESLEALNDGIIELLKYLNVTKCDVNIKKDYLEISDNYINSIDLNWFNMYEKLKGYYTEHGNINVPIYYKTPDGFLLGHWLSNIRNSFKNPNMKGTRLNSNKIKLLDELGMDWSPKDTQWKNLYNLAEEYYNKNGNLLVKDKYTAKDNIKLGRWIATQRSNYKFKLLPEDRIMLLEKIGMIWDLRNIKK